VERTHRQPRFLIGTRTLLLFYILYLYFTFFNMIFWSRNVKDIS
jgi:hypothetical protein